jgi:nitroimidazol reductase NimA-like FMN-containing flavoprotein (pyridoxamine 5'-phosphate oxidase superfamily)
MASDGHRSELLSDDECRGLLRTATMGRVGVSVNALPVIVPVTFRLAANTIRFWSASNLKLHASRAHNVVAFEVDEFHQDDHLGWSVLAVGLAAAVEDCDILDAAVRDGFRPWADEHRTHLIEMSIEVLSGLRIVPPSLSREPPPQQPSA